MKKSLLVTLDYLPKHGGVERYYHNVVKNLSPEDITVLTQPHSGDKDFDQTQDYKIIRKRLLTRFPVFWPQWINIIPYLKNFVKKK